MIRHANYIRIQCIIQRFRLNAGKFSRRKLNMHRKSETVQQQVFY